MPRDQSIHCPKCWSRYCRVTETVYREVKLRSGKIVTHTRRYRECQHCLHTFRTVETYEDPKNLGFPSPEIVPEPKRVIVPPFKKPDTMPNPFLPKPPKEES